jgi:transposase
VLLYAIGTTQSKTQEILRWFGVEMCKTSVNNTIHRVQKYLGDRKYRELEEELKNSFFCGADETSHRHMGKTFWIWVATTANTVFFRIAQSRGSKEAKKLPLAKIASCDGYRAYDKTTKRIQRCWAHLMRRLRDPSLMFNEQWEMEQFISFVKNVSSLYKQAKKESRRGTAIKQEYERKLTEIIQSKYKEEQNLVHALNYIIEYFDNWFTFLKYSGVESTNNRAERALRPLVVQRKVSQHTWSEEGREGLAITQTLYQTSKLRNEDFAQLIRQEIETGLHERGNY